MSIFSHSATTFVTWVIYHIHMTYFLIIIPIIHLEETPSQMYLLVPYNPTRPQFCVWHYNLISSVSCSTFVSIDQLISVPKLITEYNIIHHSSIQIYSCSFYILYSSIVLCKLLCKLSILVIQPSSYLYAFPYMTNITGSNRQCLQLTLASSSAPLTIWEYITLILPLAITIDLYMA